MKHRIVLWLYYDIEMMPMYSPRLFEHQCVSSNHTTWYVETMVLGVTDYVLYTLSTEYIQQIFISTSGFFGQCIQHIGAFLYIGDYRI